MNNKPTSPHFAGITSPSTDFAAVLDGRRAPIQVYELDLSTARSFTAGTAAQIKISGNSFFIDQAPDVGTAFVVFEGVQDNTGPKIRPAVYVQPGFPLSVPFANLWIANTAQPGKVLRILYGVDVDFQAATSASFQVSGNVNAVNYGAAYATNYRSTTLLAALAPDTVVAPASNTNGCIIWNAQLCMANAGNQRSALIARTAAPTTLIDGEVLHMAIATTAASYTQHYPMANPILVSAGKGIYAISELAESGAYRSVSYTLL